MTAALGAPLPATVIAIRLKARGDLARRRFTELLGSALACSCHLQAAEGQTGEVAFSAIIPDRSQTLSLLRRLISVQNEFGQIYPDCATSFLVHHGVVFPAANTFIGAALRSAHSRLARLPARLQVTATTDFADYAGTWQQSPIVFSQSSDSDAHGILNFSLPTIPALDRTATTAHEEAFLRHLTACLASHLGPFAEALVDAAKRSSASSAQLINELASEIAPLPAREKFRREAQAFSLPP